MPIKNFFLSLSLTPARSSLYLRPAYVTGMSLNCNPQNSRPSSGTTLNCTFPVLDPTPGMALNCNFGHLGHLGNIGDLHDLDPYSHDPAPTDSLPGAFITEMDPTDLGPSEGCYTDNSLNPLHARTLETAYTSHAPSGEYHTRQTDALDGHGPTSGIHLDALDGHGSFSEIEP
jgi:hypothetical protein